MGPAPYLHTTCHQRQASMVVFSSRRTFSSVSGLAYVQSSYHDSQTVQS